MTPLLAALVLVLDPGHHPDSPGALSARGHPEYLYNQEIAQLVATRLASDPLQIRPTREADEVITHRERARRADAAGAALLLSIHHDSVHPRDLMRWKDGNTWRIHSTRGRGFSLHVRPDDPRSLAAARSIARALRAAGFVPTRYHLSEFRALDVDLGIYERSRLALLNNSTVAAVILECGFIIHREEEDALNRPEVRARLGDAIASGVREALGIHAPVAAKEVSR